MVFTFTNDNRIVQQKYNKESKHDDSSTGMSIMLPPSECFRRGASNNFVIVSATFGDRIGYFDGPMATLR